MNNSPVGAATVVAPAVYVNTVAVAATNDKDKPWKGSSHGRAVTVAAPGEAVWNADRRSTSSTAQDVSTSNGTSFATAEVAGAAALWLAYHGRSAIEDAAGADTVQNLFVRSLERSSRIPDGWDSNEYGAGILDAEQLLQVPLGSPADPPSISASSAGNGAVALLARVVDRDASEMRRALTVMFGSPADFDDVIERYAPELLDVALRDPVAFQRSIDSALMPPVNPADSRPRSQAMSGLDGLLSNSLESALEPGR